MAPAYIAEIAPARQRGALSNSAAGLHRRRLLRRLLVELRVLVSVSAGGSALNEFALRHRDLALDVLDRDRSRRPLFLVLLFTIPESPRYLVANGQIRGGEGRPRPPVRLRRRPPRSRRSRAQLGSPITSRASATSEDSAARLAPHRLGRHRAGRAATARRHQRHLLLRRPCLWQFRRHRGRAEALFQNVLDWRNWDHRCPHLSYARVDRSGRKPFLVWGSGAHGHHVGHHGLGVLDQGTIGAWWAWRLVHADGHRPGSR